MIDFTYEKKTTLQDALMQLFAIVTLLRSEQGCPWDREQSPKQVSTHLIDETYEYLDAVLSDDKEGQSEELGDVLLNAMMLLEMHQETDPAAGIEALNLVCEKLIRRHPHVFSDQKVANSSEVIDVWNAIKVDVEGKTHQKDDFFSRVPPSLPPLEMANEIQKKIRKAGFDWPDAQGVFDKVQEELAEVVEAYRNPRDEREDLEMELGDLLFSAVNLCRFLGFNPSLALHRSNQKMRSRFNALYQRAQAEGVQLNQENLAEMDRLWEEIKAERRLQHEE
ncbi:MAG: nucleoside triphosphate pyrophosphohydrolase [Sphaerochaeta sp.]|jgi:MazG family protein|uniref:Nucleoside triphosphate pyrophosphohydrolase n=1 Tax=bioreactor metagenome TaxID=1076179 RepID=A0A644X8I8_9ZZZZ|nr:nucleoside triphosphate pyrophosphohydrolase [Sphaerochaeta sp.]MDT3360076.1 nucleoside triphosphate pyrophosphohydrolase [Spirochaetota bacterium]MDD2394882.1 nucleoside triphosphate pyrophosphohydrolase [Sphaerochaeta sp.]MDD3423408.1 nucleoside triphosphate pyrophosphohydrolase [Sphaerochaeta sp.]MDD4036821.1 nucleoside triphosphate pyrophosphohydrolase [Sphaerochaeta sp.]MDX9982575.1 nucleoside triphosphate pyrophosphohydrolase [Sphaerochaeta sp.]